MSNLKLTHKFLSKTFGDVYRPDKWRYISSYPLETIKYFFTTIKWKFQRMFRGWADCDAWNMDIYLSKLISEMIPVLKKEKFGNSKEKLTPKKTIDYNALELIARGFAEYNQSVKSLGCTMYISKETKEGFKYFIEYFDSLHTN